MPEKILAREHMTIHVEFDMLDKLRAYSYWSRRSIKDIVNEAFSEYFRARKVDPLPPEIASVWHRTKKRGK